MAEDPPPLWQAIVTLVLVVLMFVVLALERFPSDFVMLFTLILFLPLGILTPKEAAAGFGNDAMLTVMALLIVTASLVSTGGLELIKRLVYGLVRNDGSKSSYDIIVAVVLSAVGVLSAFCANTPLVSIFIPFMRRTWPRASTSRRPSSCCRSRTRPSSAARARSSARPPTSTRSAWRKRPIRSSRWA